MAVFSDDASNPQSPVSPGTGDKGGVSGLPTVGGPLIRVCVLLANYDGLTKLIDVCALGLDSLHIGASK